jgi:hypothetical protein
MANQQDRQSYSGVQKEKIRGMNRRGRFIQKQRTSCNHQTKTCPSANSSRSINSNKSTRSIANESLAVNNSGCGGQVFILFFQILAKSTDKPAPTLSSMKHKFALILTITSLLPLVYFISRTKLSQNFQHCH